METSAVTNDNIRDLTVKLGRQTCLAPRSIGKRSIDAGFSLTRSIDFKFAKDVRRPFSWKPMDLACAL